MLLAVDIGNSSIDLGVFDESGSLLTKSKMSAVRTKCTDEYAVILSGILTLHGIGTDRITEGIISSVVPPLTAAVSSAIEKLFGFVPIEVGPGIKTGLNIRIDSQAQLGADLVANSVAAIAQYPLPLVVVDIGTATTFTGQNYAAGQNDRCRRILWLCLGLSTVCSSVPIFVIVLFRSLFSSLFAAEAAVIESAGVRILCILLFGPICNFYEIPAGVLRGSGHALYPAVSTVVGTCVFRILWVYTVFRAAPTLPTLYHAFPLSWIVTIVLVNLGFLIMRPLKDSGFRATHRRNRP